MGGWINIIFNSHLYHHGNLNTLSITFFLMDHTFNGKSRLAIIPQYLTISCDNNTPTYSYHLISCRLRSVSQDPPVQVEWPLIFPGSPPTLTHGVIMLVGWIVTPMLSPLNQVVQTVSILSWYITFPILRPIDVYSDVLSGILSDIYIYIYSDILSDIYSDVLSGILPDLNINQTISS